MTEIKIEIEVVEGEIIRNNKREWKECIVCKELYLVGGRPGRRRLSGRHSKSITCSKRCSREYHRNKSKYKNI